MATVRIRGVEVPIDWEVELEPYLNRFGDYRIRGNKLQSKSPFRFERHPSFGLNLDTLVWIDSGSPTDLYHKGNFVSLLAYLRQEEYQDTEEYLIQAYYAMMGEIDKLQLIINLSQEETPKVFNWKDMKHLHYRHPYLGRRGILRSVQHLFLVGYDKEHEAIALPWISTKKEIINIKYRSIRYKQFFYEPDGQLTKNYVYGLAQCIFKGYKDVAIVESEIDCMYLWSNGIPAVAMGHAGINKTQIGLLVNAGIETVIIASDNDQAGFRFRESMEKNLPRYFTVMSLDFPMCYKDVNDIPSKELTELYKNRSYTKIQLDISI